MSLPVELATAARVVTLPGLALPLRLDEFLPGESPWEVELGFGKGRYLLRRALAEPGRRFLGVELVGLYYRGLVRRLRRRQLGNVLAARGEALFLLAAVLPRAFASDVHVYFPDPWPKTRHHRRRLFDPETVDLVLGLLRPGGTLWFASDHPDYGPAVAEILSGYPGLQVTPIAGGWPEGPRTHYEAKYAREGRPIVRLCARFDPAQAAPPLHPRGSSHILVGVRAPAVAAEVATDREGAQETTRASVSLHERR